MSAIIINIITFLFAFIFAVKMYQASRGTRSEQLIYFSLFFTFLGIDVLINTILISISQFVIPEIISLGYIFTRIIIFIALYFLLQTPIFTRYAIIKNNINFVKALVILLLLVTSMIQIINFSNVDVSEQGYVVLNMHPAAAWITGLFSFLIGLIASHSFIFGENMFPNDRARSNSILLGIAGLFLGTGDLVYLIGKTPEMVFYGVTLSLIGYSVTILILVIKYFKSKKNNQEQIKTPL